MATGVLLAGPTDPSQEEEVSSWGYSITSWREHFEAGAKMMVGVFLV